MHLVPTSAWSHVLFTCPQCLALRSVPSMCLKIRILGSLTRFRPTHPPHSDSLIAENYSQGSQICCDDHGSWYMITSKGNVYKNDSKVASNFSVGSHMAAANDRWYVVTMKGDVYINDVKDAFDLPRFPPGSRIAACEVENTWFVLTPTGALYSSTQKIAQLDGLGPGAGLVSVAGERYITTTSGAIYNAAGEIVKQLDAVDVPFKSITLTSP